MHCSIRNEGLRHCPFDEKCTLHLQKHNVFCLLTGFCFDKAAGTRHAHPCDMCAQFVECGPQDLFWPKRCPVGTVYNPTYQWCDWPHAVSYCSDNTPTVRTDTNIQPAPVSTNTNAFFPVPSTSSLNTNVFFPNPNPPTVSTNNFFPTSTNQFTSSFFPSPNQNNNNFPSSASNIWASLFGASGNIGFDPALERQSARATRRAAVGFTSAGRRPPPGFRGHNSNFRRN